MYNLIGEFYECLLFPLKIFFKILDAIIFAFKNGVQLLSSFAEAMKCILCNF